MDDAKGPISTPSVLEERIYETYVTFNHNELLEKISYFDQIKHHLDLNLDIVKRETPVSD